MEEVQPLPEYLRLMIHFDPEALTGVQTAEAPLQLLLDIVRNEEPYRGQSPAIPAPSDLPFTGVRGRVLAQILAQDLTDVRLRQFVAELDQSRHFVAGEFASAEIAHRLGVKRRIAAHDKSLDGFPAGRVRHTDYAAILHARKPGEHGFHLIGRDIEA